jgi:excisionase family DNA binding protein
VPDEWLTVREVAQELRVKERTVRRWITAGRLPAAQVTPRSSLRIRRSDLERLLRSNQQ